MSEVKVSVTIPDARSFEKTVRAASRVGLRVHDKLDILGIATGSIEEHSLSRLRSVPGIDVVEEQQEISTPAPVKNYR